MKNLKRLMSVVLSVVMLLSFVIGTSAATFTDVAETDNAYQAIEVLAALEILEGKEAGVFDPEANIKRSEFAAVICRAMNQTPVGVATFVDVPEDHWAYDYIAWAASQNIVKGKGEGKFDPDANVTYNEAITMIVRAMGYEYYVEEFLGGFPTGYARIAGSYKMDKGVNTANGNAAATRADVAQLVYNAFDAPLMDYNYAIGSDMEYVIYNGSKNVDEEKRTLLSYYSDIYKFKATVTNTFKNNSSLIDAKGNKKIALNVLSAYGFDADWLNDALNDQYKANITAYAANDAWADLAGYTVDAYITLNDAEKLEVVAMVPVTSGDELVIENAKEMINKSVVSGGVTFEYEDENGRKQTPDILYIDEAGTDDDEFAQVYVNNRNLGAINDAGDAQAAFESLDDGAFASVTLLDADNDGVYEAIYLTNYIYGIVEEVDADYEIIEMTSGDALELSEDDTQDGFVYTIYKDGAEIAITDLVAGDLLNIVVGDADYDDITAVATATFVDIYVTNNTIESSVSSYSPALDAYTIDGENYYIAPGETLTINPGDTGIFYITIDGYIYDVDFTSTHSDNYGIILEMGDNPSAFGTTWEIKILDKNNNVVTYPVKSSMFITSTGVTSVMIDGVSTPVDADTTYARRQYKSTTNLDAKMTTIENAINAANDSTFAVDSDITDAEDAEAAMTDLQAARLVTFKVVNDEITELVFPTTVAGDRNLVSDELDGYYSSKTGRLNGMELLDSSVLFNIPVAAVGVDTSDPEDDVVDEYVCTLDIDDFQVYAQSGLVNDKKYTGFVYDYDSNTGAFGAALLTNDMGFAGNETALAVVISNSTGLDANGNTTNVITFMQAGETKSLALADVYKASGYDLANAATGDVFQYTTNAAGEIIKSEGIYTAADTTLLTVGEPDEIGYIAGLVTKNTNKVVNIANSDDADEAYAWDLADGCTNVLFNIERAGKANAFNAKNGTSYIRAARIGDANAFESDAYVIVAKTDDGVIVDVVAYLYSEDYLTAAANDAIDTDTELIAAIVTPAV